MTKNINSFEMDNKIKTKMLIDYLEGVIADEMVMNSFIRGMKIHSVINNEVIISLPSQEVISVITIQYGTLIKDAINEIYNSPLGYKFVVEEDLKKMTLNNSEIKKEEKKVVLTSKNISSKFKIEDYVVSNFNEEIVRMANNTIKNPGMISPMFVSSKSGLGKTHLLHAIGNEVQKFGYSAYYIESNQFTNLISSLRNEPNKINDYVEELSKYDFLLFDDIQMLGARDVSLSVLFNIINNHIINQKQIIICADKSPEELSGFEDRFITRFIQGISLKIHEPDIDDMIKILEFKLRKNNLHPEKWENEAIRFIARNNLSSIRAIEGSLNRVIFSTGSISNVKYTYSVISNIFKKINLDIAELTPMRILDNVASYYKINRKDITGKSRKAEIVQARYMAIWLVKKMLNLTLEEIGEIFGGRDHSTIIAALRNIEQSMKINTIIKTAAKNLEDRIIKIS